MIDMSGCTTAVWAFVKRAGGLHFCFSCSIPLLGIVSQVFVRFSFRASRLEAKVFALDGYKVEWST